MRISCFKLLTRLLIFSVCLFCVRHTPYQAVATNFTWTQGSCGFLGCGWSTPTFWSPTGPPSTGDHATISLDVPVVLTQNTGSLNGLTLENSAAVYTFGSQLNVTDSNANTFLFGTGTTGGNTQIVVNSGAALGIDFIGDFISLHLGAELKMLGGGAVSTFGFNISPSSIISGYGNVYLLGTGTKFDVAGTLKPDGGQLTIGSFAVDRLDLDGNINGVEHGFLDVTAGGKLLIQGSLADPYSGIANIGNSNILEFDTILDFDGTLNYTAGSGNSIVAPSINFNTGSLVTVDNASGEISSPSVWTGNTQISLVNGSDELHLAANSDFAFSTVFSGQGRVVNDSGATMILRDGADVSTRLHNDGTLDVESSSAGFALLEEYSQSQGGRLNIDLGGYTPGVNFDHISITEDAGLSGMLNISLIGGFSLTPGDSFEIVNIDGTLTSSFNGLGEGSIVDTLSDLDLYITYFGGDGNDVVLYTVLPGDFDFDGDVDGKDFRIWQNGDSPNPHSQSDYNDWQANFGSPGPAVLAAVIPEPASSTMLIFSLVVVMMRNHRQNKATNF